MTPGQQLAMEQLSDIARASGGHVELLRADPPSQAGEVIRVVVSVDCGDFKRHQDGLPLRSRERIVITVPAAFPFKVPSASVEHLRFAGFAHVQWGCHLCLYQSPQTEWDASDGMFGYMSRLVHWLRRGACNEFELAGEPLHPPVAYSTPESPLVVVRENTPPVEAVSWLGFAEVERLSPQRTDVHGWSDSLSRNTKAGVILLSSPLAWEFPTRGEGMLKLLEKAGVSAREFVGVAAAAASTLAEDAPLLLIIGTPMRGLAGATRKAQHLTAWEIPSEVAGHLRHTLPIEGETQELRVIINRITELTEQIIRLSPIQWCRVAEDREEVATPRDAGSPMAWFKGKTVSIWGCGAIGSIVAEATARAGASKIVLVDNGVVRPGVIARQLFEDADVGAPKAEALARRLARVRRSGTEIVAECINVIDAQLESGEWASGCDVVIDATASEVIAEKLELILHSKSTCRVPIASLVVGHRATYGMVSVVGREYSGGIYDVNRKCKLATCDRAEWLHFADEFWPRERGRIPFQPEPGCSDPTFVGSWSDVAALAASLLNEAAIAFAAEEDTSARATLLVQSHVELPSGQARIARVQLASDVRLSGSATGYDVRMTGRSRREISGWVESSRRLRGSRPETGGVLFGERNDACRVVWLDEVIGPPPDSDHSPELFVCGVEGVREISVEKTYRSRGTVQYIGMWHTHPVSRPVPSSTDLHGVSRIMAEENAPSRFLLLIVGHTATEETWSFGVHSFVASATRNQGASFATSGFVQAQRSEPQWTVGLALSGGGARAIAFHLGCFRALHDLRLLKRVKVVSAVSGGSIIAALYAYASVPFEVFEARVVSLLRRGLTRDIIKKLMRPRVLGGVAATMAISGSTAFLGRMIGRHPYFRRRVSRTTAFQMALSEQLYGETKLNEVARNGLDIVINATDLTTGTAFRFGSRESGNWRTGRVVGNAVPVAHAVAASAAYPALLPAFDEIYEFEGKDGVIGPRRVVLTDGGVFENLGVSCLDPTRSPDFGFNSYRTDFIISCDAGVGQLSGAIPYGWPTRMTRSFETVFRKVQDGTRQRMHELAREGHLKGFALSYLGQQDGNLAGGPVDLVSRAEVIGYPTDFSAMSDAWIERLAKRGEQLTRHLLDRYCPDL